MNSSVPVASSRSRNRNGRSTVIVTRSTGAGIEVTPITIAVAAEASVPSSSTLTKALCSALLTDRSRVPSIPEKSASCGSKASVRPSAFRLSPNGRLGDSWNFGSRRSTSASVASARPWFRTSGLKNDSTRSA